jgi:hypothetical protein
LRLRARVVRSADNGGWGAAAGRAAHGIVDELRTIAARCCGIADKSIAGGLRQRLVSTQLGAATTTAATTTPTTASH